MSWKDEADHQKINAMPQYPQPGKRTLGKIIWLLFLIALFAGAIFAIATPAGRAFWSEFNGM